MEPALQAAELAAKPAAEPAAKRAAGPEPAAAAAPAGAGPGLGEARQPEQQQRRRQRSPAARRRAAASTDSRASQGLAAAAQQPSNAARQQHGSQVPRAGGSSEAAAPPAEEAEDPAFLQDLLAQLLPGYGEEAPSEAPPPVAAPAAAPSLQLQHARTTASAPSPEQRAQLAQLLTCPISQVCWHSGLSPIRLGSCAAPSSPLGASAQVELRDPVILSDGWTYERSAAEAWLRGRGAVSPVTGVPLASAALRPNSTLKAAMGMLLGIP
jgi:hypothetical protein